MHSLALLSALAGLATAASPLSQRMLDGIMSRKQGIVSSGQATSTLESGILSIALEATMAHYPDTRSHLGDYLSKVLDTTAADLLNATADAVKPLDRLSVATAISDAGRYISLPPNASAALKPLTESLVLQKRNPDGGFWYYVYPQWSYLDGMFSLLPFMADDKPQNYTDMALQVSLVADHCYHAESGLYVHGYDWSKTAVWADKTTGASPYVWGRSLGWFLSGLVQTWERMDCGKHHNDEDEKEDAAAAGKGDLCGQMQHIFSKAAAHLVTFADTKTGAWWQLPTFPGREGNFLESSSTALFIFSLLKAQRIGMFESAATRHAALRAYGYTKCNFVTKDADGVLGYNKTVIVNSLNSTASYEYYTSRPIVPNGLLGEAAFVLASVEVERL